MESTYVSDEHQPSNRLGYAILLVAAGLVLMVYLFWQFPGETPNRTHSQTIERLQREARCTDAIVVEFHPGLWRVECPPEG